MMIFAMTATSTCPGCGLELPSTGLPVNRRSNASHECIQVKGEVAGFELDNLVQLGRLHQLTVDAYGAQHAGGQGSGIRVAYSLVGLQLALERGFTGLQVRDLHQRMGKPGPDWPRFNVPPNPGPVTVVEVAIAGHRAGSVEGHAETVERWARSVWAAWAARHDDVNGLTDRVIGLAAP
jgi:hypothetical protein